MATFTRGGSQRKVHLYTKLSNYFREKKKGERGSKGKLREKLRRKEKKKRKKERRGGRQLGRREEKESSQGKEGGQPP